MKTKRVIIITIVLLILASILFGFSWYLKKKGDTPSDRIISFREFLGIGQRLTPGDTDQDFGSDFESNPLNDQNYDKNNNGIADWLEDLNNNGIIDGDEDLNNNNTPDRLEDANNNGIPDIYENINSIDGGTNPGESTTGNDGWEDGDGTGEGEWPGDDDWGDGTNPGDGGTIGDGGTTEGGNNNNGVNTAQVEGSIVSFDTGSNTDFNWSDAFATFTEGVGVQSCRADDITIQFTDEELANLRALEARYNQISDELYSREAVQEQRNVHNQLKLKYYRLVELNNFCAQNAPLITNPKMQKRVPTPFWHDNAKDSASFTNYVISTSDLNNYGTTDRTSGKANAVHTKPQNFITLFERMFRVNIW